MSKARVIKNNSLRNKMKRFIAPKHPFLRLFGATDAFHQYYQQLNDLAFSTNDIGLGPASFIPLPTPLSFSDSSPEAIQADHVSETHLLPDNTEVVEPKIDQIEGGTRRDEDLESLLSVMESSGLKISEVETLSSGVTRISVDDLFDMHKSKEPVYVKVRG